MANTKQFQIKVSGSGTKEEIIKALNSLASSIAETSEEGLDGAEIEDAVLMTELSELSEEEIAELNEM